MSVAEMFNLFDRVKFGEIALIEHRSSSYVPDLLSLLLKRYAEERGYMFIVDDNLDILHVINEHLKAFGVSGAFDDAIVVKTGGLQKVGRVASRINVEGEPSVYLPKYSHATEGVFSQAGKSVNVVLGLERIFAFINNLRDFYIMILGAQGFLGNTKRKAFYFMDIDVAEKLPINPLPELERIATTVIDAEPELDKINVLVLKAPDVDIIEERFSFSLNDVIQKEGTS
ncbi:DUF257 family protein [Thermococcus sp.]|uniref:DUF257 family protein n=1 Tax=Thermococcus sp. TaxID=35749 RepID=UPI002616DCFF|nr:DUF257 family protein [Thermococcus sp.]